METTEEIMICKQKFEEMLIEQQRSVFVNPTDGQPILVEHFLNFLDLTPVLTTLEERYKEKYRFKYPMEAMLRTMIYFKLKGYTFLTDVFRDLVALPNLATDLGFDFIPDYKTLYHFLIYRLGSKGVKEIFDVFVKANIEEAKNQGLTIGDEVGMDACPIPAKKKDEEADWNGHYEIWCYLWHNFRCMDTNLPLDYHLTNGREDEAHFFAPFLLRLISQYRIKPNRVFVDCGYSSFENIARSYVYWNIEVVSNIAKDWIYHEDATKKDIDRWYQKLWKEPYFKPKASWGYKLYALMLTDETRFKLVGKHYRNNILTRYEECPDGYLDHYHLRNRIESHHGTEKRNFEIKNIEAKGIERTSAHMGMHLIGLHAVALCRLQHEVTTGLINTVGLV